MALSDPYTFFDRERRPAKRKPGMTSKFRVQFVVSMEVEVDGKRSPKWVDENVVEELMADLVNDGFIVDDASVEKVAA